jgi:alkylation response protein AidB-like acyl-CoA dehydrogenase
MAMTDAVRRLFADKHDESVVRANMEARSGFDPAFWSALAELGVTGLLVDADHGGLGGGPLEVEAIMEEAGAALLGAPLLSSFMATALIEGSGDSDARTRLLPAIAQGRIVALALTGDVGTWTEDGVALIADREDALLSGHASFVLHGANAELLLAIARTVDGFGVFEVAPDTAGLNSMPLPTFDRTLRLARLTFDKVPAHRLDAAGWSTVARTLQLGLVALETESAISAARAAAAALASTANDADELVALAAFTCADAYDRAAADAIQMHGGIAFTWAHPAHLYLRRARADLQLFGTPAAHRERYLKALGA